MPCGFSRSAYRSFSLHIITAKPTPDKIGGELGAARAFIDTEKLDAYLEAHVPEIAASVTEGAQGMYLGSFIRIFGLWPYWLQSGQYSPDASIV